MIESDQRERAEPEAVAPRGPTSDVGWLDVEDEVRQLTERLRTAYTVSDYQDIGLRCRTILITLGRLGFDPMRHAREGERPPKGDNAKERLARIVAVELTEADEVKLGALVATACANTWSAACELVHDRSAGRSKATIVAGSTLFVVRAIRQIQPEAVPNSAGYREDWGAEERLEPQEEAESLLRIDRAIEAQNDASDTGEL